MGTVSEVKLAALLDLAEAGEVQVERWKRGTKNNADLTYQQMQLVIGNEADYKAKLALPAATAYAPVMNPAFVSRSGLDRNRIVRKQADNITNGYENYRASLAHAFETVDGETAKRYKESIDASAEVYSRKVAQNVLSFMGSREVGKGLVPIATLWLTGDTVVEGHLRGDDQVGLGGPLNVARLTPDMRSALKSALANRLMQSGKVLISADWNPTVMVAENDHINALIASLQNTAYVAFATGGVSHCDWVVIDGRKYLEIKVATP
ncbi:MAG: hypothetical protein HY762_08410 [Planctomycetes bacterium]|nr:hypothetical protein [Planctomycetota bacterium]